MTRIKLSMCLLSGCFLLLTVAAHAQGPMTGYPPYGSFQNGAFDGVDLQDLNVNFAIPIFHSPGRGIDLQLGLVYNSPVWGGSGTYWYQQLSGGWAVTSPTGSISYNETTLRVKCGDGSWNYNTTDSGFAYLDPAGTWHAFPTIRYTDIGCTGGFTGTTSAYASDGSGYFMNGVGISVKSPSGITIAYSGSMTDTNGNYISNSTVSNETDWTDTVGHSHGNGTLRIIKNPSTIQYENLDVNGVYQTVTETLSLYTIKTNFACSGITEYTGTSQVYLPTSISLPNLKSYTFVYEQTPGGTTSQTTGRIQKVTLPTGGYYEYDYGGTNDGVSCANGSTVNLTRKISDGANISTWTFSRAPSGSNWVTTETAPQLPYDSAGNQTLYTFNSLGQEVTRQIYEGSASLLRTINTTWASNGTPATQITILEDNSTQNKVETTYDTLGNLQLLKEHGGGWGPPAGGLKKTTNTLNTSSTYTNRNTWTLLMTQTIADSTGTIQSRTDIAYDTERRHRQDIHLRFIGKSKNSAG